jgi:hypothetical protein
MIVPTTTGVLHVNEDLKISCPYMNTSDLVNGENGDDPPDLKPLHPESSLDPGAIDYWRRQRIEDIVDSLRPGSDEALRVFPNGTIANGNTRFYVLRERGFDVNSLPRQLYNPGPLPGAPDF